MQERIFINNNDSGYSKKWRVVVLEPFDGKGFSCGDIINEEDRYKQDINEKNNPKVYFFDMTAKRDVFPQGQFVASYYLSTLVANIPTRKYYRGLNLYGDVDSWSIEAGDYKIIIDWLFNIQKCNNYRKDV